MKLLQHKYAQILKIAKIYKATNATQYTVDRYDAYIDRNDVVTGYLPDASYAEKKWHQQFCQYIIIILNNLNVVYFQTAILVDILPI